MLGRQEACSSQFASLSFSPSRARFYPTVSLPLSPPSRHAERTAIATTASSARTAEAALAPETRRRGIAVLCRERGRS